MEKTVSYKYPFKQAWSNEHGDSQTVENIIGDLSKTLDLMKSHHKSEINKIEFMMKTDFETNAAGNEKFVSDLEKHKKMLEYLDKLEKTL